MKIETVLIRGYLHFIVNYKSSFRGPIKKGFRPTVWLHNINEGATSSSILSEGEINMGETKDIEIIILNELQMPVKLKKGMKINIGSPSNKIAELTIIEHLGLWEGSVP